MHITILYIYCSIVNIVGFSLKKNYQVLGPSLVPYKRHHHDLIILKLAFKLFTCKPAYYTPFILQKNGICILLVIDWMLGLLVQLFNFFIFLRQWKSNILIDSCGNESIFRLFFLLYWRMVVGKWYIAPVLYLEATKKKEYTWLQHILCKHITSDI